MKLKTLMKPSMSALEDTDNTQLSNEVVADGSISLVKKKMKNPHRSPGPLHGSLSPLSPVEPARVVRPN